MAKNGDYYWVLAHVTPSYEANGKIDSYNSNRRLPSPAALAKVEPLYRALLAEEQKHADRKQGQAAGFAMLVKLLQDAGRSAAPTSELQSLMRSTYAVFAL